MSQGRAWSIEKLLNRTGGYRFRYHNSCGTGIPGKWRQNREVRMLRSCTAHALSKKKNSKTEIRTTVTRSACKRLADCANRASMCRVIWKKGKLGNAKGLNFTLRVSRLASQRKANCERCSGDKEKTGEGQKIDKRQYQYSFPCRRRRALWVLRKSGRSHICGCNHWFARCKIWRRFQAPFHDRLTFAGKISNKAALPWV